MLKKWFQEDKARPYWQSLTTTFVFLKQSIQKTQNDLVFCYKDYLTLFVENENQCFIVLVVYSRDCISKVQRWFRLNQSTSCDCWSIFGIPCWNISIMAMDSHVWGHSCIFYDNTHVVYARNSQMATCNW